jgi:hypothetical protein
LILPFFVFGPQAINPVGCLLEKTRRYRPLFFPSESTN